MVRQVLDMRYAHSQLLDALKRVINSPAMHNNGALNLEYQRALVAKENRRLKKMLIYPK